MGELKSEIAKEKGKQSITNATKSFMTILSDLGISEDKCNKIRTNIFDCLKIHPESKKELDTKELYPNPEISGGNGKQFSQNEQENNPQNQLKGEQKNIGTKNNESIANNKIDKNIEKYCNNFRSKIKGISNADSMINLLEELIKTKKLEVKPLATGKEIVLDCLNCEIKILDLGNEANKTNSYKIKKRDSSLNSTISYYETDEKGMEKISEKRDLISQRWIVATQADIQNILKTLTKKYNLTSGRQGDIHDEDIAFFMLITQSDGEFLLQKDKSNGKNRVLKQYHDFRGFKDLKEHGTGQIILIRKK